MKTLINPRLPNSFGNFLTKWVKFRASTNNMLYKVNYQCRIAFQIVNPVVVTSEIPHPHSCRSPQSVLYIYIYIYMCVCVCVCVCVCGPGSSVGIATGRSGIESRWGRDFPPVQTGPGAHPASCKKGTGSFPGVKCGRGVLLTTHPLLVPRSWKSRDIPLPTVWATSGL